MYRRHHDQDGISLIELLVGMIIASILTTLILGTWFALQDSFSYSMTSNFQRDNARTALSRMQREIRDAEALAGNGPALYRAHEYYVAFFTTFNKALNTNAGTLPRLVAYRLYKDGTLWRFYDKNGDGIGGPVAGISPGSAEPIPDNPKGYDTIEQKNGEGATMMLDHVVNFSRPAPAGPLPMFTYLFYDTTGVLQTSSLLTGTADITNTIAVTSRILEDVNPAHSPVYADLQVTSQLRNQR